MTQDERRLAQLMNDGQVLQAEMLALRVLDRVPGSLPALSTVAACAELRDDHARSASYLQKILGVTPGAMPVRIKAAMALLQSQQAAEALALLGRMPEGQTWSAEAWLMLGFARHASGLRDGALRAWFNAVEQAQSSGRWLNRATTPEELLPWVLEAMEALKTGRRAMLEDILAPIEKATGSGELLRVRRAIANYLRETQDGPTDPRQRPKFLYMPGLPDQPYHDPMLQPWARTLSEAFPEICADASEVYATGAGFESFLEFGPQAKRSDYVGGDGPDPAWDAFFFYRHGKRFDDKHQICHRTSAVLESIELCRIKGQAPEVCFSVLAPGSHIKPHHGVTNTRLVMHLPLIVPEGCALNILGAGEHAWKPGELMMFDDSYQHEAWNTSASPRIILLMDCWNPHLSSAEKLAVTALVEGITEFESERQGQ